MDKENHLFPEDPYYLPRYCGYLPQFKYRIGKTYGNHSSDILTDSNVRRSPRYVLSSTEPVYPQNPTREVAILRSKRDNWGSELYTEHMLPGYAGYIPKNQHYFSRPYGDVCKSALSHHEVEQSQMAAQRQEDKKILSAKTGLPNVGHSTDSRIPYPPSRNPPKSTYFQRPDNPMWFKSGYTGFVPRTRELIALGYPSSTNVGLRAFNESLNGNEARRGEVVSVDRPRTQPEPKAVLYPKNNGMIPHYTGYIPAFPIALGVSRRHEGGAGHFEKHWTIHTTTGHKVNVAPSSKLIVAHNELANCLDKVCHHTCWIASLYSPYIDGSTYSAITKLIRKHHDLTYVIFHAGSVYGEEK